MDAENNASNLDDETHEVEIADETVEVDPLFDPEAHQLDLLEHPDFPRSFTKPMPVALDPNAVAKATHDAHEGLLLWEKMKEDEKKRAKAARADIDEQYAFAKELLEASASGVKTEDVAVTAYALKTGKVLVLRDDTDEFVLISERELTKAEWDKLQTQIPGTESAEEGSEGASGNDSGDDADEEHQADGDCPACAEPFLEGQDTTKVGKTVMHASCGPPA